MLGDVALLLGYSDLRGVRYWRCCPSPWLPQAVSPGWAGNNTRFYFAPIQDEDG